MKPTELRRFFRTPGSGDDAAQGLQSAARLLWSRRGDPELARVYQGHAWSVPLQLFARPLAAAPRWLSSSGRYRHSDQRPTVYLPFLESEPWWPADDFTRRLEAEHAVIREEFGRIEHELRRHPQKWLVEAGDWHTFNLYRHGERYERHCALCPRTAEIVASMPVCTEAGGMAYFSIMDPGTHVLAHNGFTNTRIRYHLGVEAEPGARFRVSDETREWETGRAFAFDDSFEHEVHHTGDARRVVLLVDCWHPALSTAERALVRDLLRALELPQR